jgi:uncharacterized membrane protein
MAAVKSKSNPWMLLAGLTASGAALYFLDRSQGPQRRAQFAKRAWRVADAIGESLVDSRHRLTGLAHNAWSVVGTGQPDDRVLEERVRSRMGRIVARPHYLHVASDDGVVTLWGMASTVEARKLVHAVGALRGVKEVLDHLELHDTAEPPPHRAKTARAGDPGTAASGPCPNYRDVVARAHHETLLNWSPAKRMLVGTAGLVTAAYGLKRRGPLGYSLSLLGAGLVAASTMKKNVQSLLALKEDSAGFELEETIRINAPVSDVYEFWINPENYPKVFSNITAIERQGENLYRWTLTGPAGIPVNWEGMITRAVPNTLVQWKSLPGSTLGNFGVARFDPNYDASTRLHVRMFYRPPAGLLGRFLAELFGADPKKVLEQDLQRLKHRFETEEGFIKELRQGGVTEELLKTAKT